jgi:mannose-6-phosphate isomerase-like protein (cupin superfamily)
MTNVHHKIIAKTNDDRFNVVRLRGDLVWHDHPETDQKFIVIEGDLRIDFRTGAVYVSTAR